MGFYAVFADADDNCIFLFNDLLRHKKCLKDLAPPGFKIDNYEEYSEGWDSIPD